MGSFSLSLFPSFLSTFLSSFLLFSLSPLLSPFSLPPPLSFPSYGRCSVFLRWPHVGDRSLRITSSMYAYHRNPGKQSQAITRCLFRLARSLTGIALTIAHTVTHPLHPNTDIFLKPWRPLPQGSLNPLNCHCQEKPESRLWSAADSHPSPTKEELQNRELAHCPHAAAMHWPVCILWALMQCVCW